MQPLKTAIETAEAVRCGELKAVDAVQACADAIAECNTALNAFVYLDIDTAMAAAAEIDARVAAGEDPGLLAGVPFGVKDLEDCRGMVTSQGSMFLKDSPPAKTDSINVARLRAAGAIPLGKTATAEFGMDSATCTPAFGVTRNPWNHEKTPGGSSGGSSAAVAGSMVPLCTATDGGGSIREPASFTGLVGLKPSHGRIPKKGGFSNFAVHGCLSRTVADTARYLDVVAGPDDRDRQSLPALDYHYETLIETLPVAGLRAQWSADHGYAVVEPEVVAICRAAFDRLLAAAQLELVNTPVQLTNIYSHWGAISLAGLEEDFTRQGILPDGFDQLAPQTRHLLQMMRERADEVDVKASWEQIYQLERDVAALFQATDLLITPTVACKPYAADSLIPEIIDGRDASETGAEPFGMLANACWNPSISIPAGISSDGLPIGLQITARRHRDDILLRLARIWEQTQPWSYPA